MLYIICAWSSHPCMVVSPWHRCPVNYCPLRSQRILCAYSEQQHEARGKAHHSHEKPSGFSGKVAPERWMTTLAAKWPARTPSGRSLPAKS